MLGNLFADSRYMLIFVDGVIVSVLIIILTVRLISRAISPSSAPAAGQPHDPSKPKTVDQLGVDIPL